jgi:hypothetical protein
MVKYMTTKEGEFGLTIYCKGVVLLSIGVFTGLTYNNESNNRCESGKDEVRSRCIHKDWETGANPVRKPAENTKIIWCQLISSNYRRLIHYFTSLSMRLLVLRDARIVASTWLDKILTNDDQFFYAAEAST